MSEKNKKTASENQKSTVKKTASKCTWLRKLRNKKLVLAVLSVMLVFAVCLSVFCGYNEYLEKKIGVYYGSVLQTVSVYDIRLTEDEVAQRLKQTKRHGAAPFKYFCEDEITFRTEAAYGSLLLANPQSNDCDMVATILDNEGNLIYRSGGIAPGKYLSQIQMMYRLPAGEYNCRLYVTGFDRVTQQKVGLRYTKLKIIVEGNVDE